MVADMTTFRDPRVQPQLNNGSSSGPYDCTFRVCESAIVWVTDAPSPSIAQMRTYLGNPKQDGHPAGIDLLDAKKVCEHFAPTGTYVFTKSVDDIRSALASGAYVLCAVDYGWVNANAPELSGDHRFTGNHAVGTFGVEKVGRRTWSEWHDPLHDARRPNIPKANVMARRRSIEGSMAAMDHGTQALICRRQGT